MGSTIDEANGFDVSEYQEAQSDHGIGAYQADCAEPSCRRFRVLVPSKVWVSFWFVIIQLLPLSVTNNRRSNT